MPGGVKNIATSLISGRVEKILEAGRYQVRLDDQRVLEAKGPLHLAPGSRVILEKIPLSRVQVNGEKSAASHGETGKFAAWFPLAFEGAREARVELFWDRSKKVLKNHPRAVYLVVSVLTSSAGEVQWGLQSIGKNIYVRIFAEQPQAARPVVEETLNAFRRIGYELPESPVWVNKPLKGAKVLQVDVTG